MDSQTRPEWLEKTASGLTTSHMYRAYLVGKKYAIIFCPGYTSYVNRMTGNAYSPSEYILVEKGKNYWDHIWVTVHQGRLNMAVKGRLARVLEEAEERGDAFIKELKDASRRKS